MEKIKIQVHIQRRSIAGYKDGNEYQRLTYDMTRQTPESIAELNSVLKYLAARSRGEFQYWITGDVNSSSEDPECKELAAEFEEHFT